MSTVDFPVSFTFSGDVQLGTGCVIFENDFGDQTKACDAASGITIGEKNATIQLKDKFYYGSSYRVYFEKAPFVDNDGNEIVLVKGDYVFSVDSNHFMSGKW